MFRYFLEICVISLLFSSLLFANNGLHNSRQIVLVHIQKCDIDREIVGEHELIEPESGEFVAYIFQLDKGFVIVSPDDDMPPILGYSFENQFLFDCLPSRVMSQMYQKMLTNINKADLDWRKRNNLLRESYLNESPVYRETMTVYGPLITLSWHQNPPYNDYCPMDPSSGNRCVVGCTATAMGMMFCYYQWPPSVSFTDAESYMSTYTDPDIWIDAVGANIGFINYLGGSPSSDMAAQISKAAGVSVTMNYHPGGSSSSVDPSIFMSKWQYAYCREVATTSGTFYADLANSIINNDPAPLTISYMDGGRRYGHRVIADGYNDVNGKFHINFGWGGMSDGWWTLPIGLPSDYDTVEDAIIDFAIPTFARHEVPGTYATIQTAIDVAVGGDTVVVAAGTYTGLGNKNLDFDGKWVYLKSAGGFHSVTIDLQSSGRFAHFQDGETPEAVIDGFRIINGSEEDGGAIFVDDQSCPTIRNCYFESNSADYGGALAVRSSWGTWTLVENCVFFNNSASWNGGGVYSGYGDVVLVNCTINGNTANSGGGLSSYDSGNIVFFNSILWGNTCSSSGSDIYVAFYGFGDPCEIYMGNSDYNPANCVFASGGGSIEVGDGNINAAPDFLSFCSLSETSAGVDQGASDVFVFTFDLSIEAPARDILSYSRPQGVTWDMGAYDYTISAEVSESNIKPQSMSIAVFPNPFNSSLEISAPNNADVSVYSIDGIEIAKLGKSRIWNADNNVPAGIYLIRFDLQNKVEYRKAVLVR